MESSKASGRVMAALMSAVVVLATSCSGEVQGPPIDQSAGTPETSPPPVETPEVETPPAEVTVFAKDYSFEIAPTLPGGPTRFHLVNKGQEPHMFILAHLEPDAPRVGDLIKLSEKFAREFISDQKVIPPVKPRTKGKQTFTMDLVAGDRYAYVCFVRSPKKSKGKGKEHAFLGMRGELTAE